MTLRSGWHTVAIYCRVRLIDRDASDVSRDRFRNTVQHAIWRIRIYNRQAIGDVEVAFWRRDGGTVRTKLSAYPCPPTRSGAHSTLGYLLDDCQACESDRHGSSRFKPYAIDLR
jgi:hypothetical protein